MSKNKKTQTKNTKKKKIDWKKYNEALVKRGEIY